MIELSDLNSDAIGAWSIPVKVMVTSVFCLLLAYAWFTFDTKNQINRLAASAQKEIVLKSEFEMKYHLVVNKNVYEKQLRDIEGAYGTMLNQLPSMNELPQLLEEISRKGVESGLKFKLFKPLEEKKYEFYAELPIKMAVIGNYHQLAQFISSIASLDRIVTLHDFSIKHVKKTGGSKASNQAMFNENLVMNITAKTYRYYEQSKS